MKILVLNCGSSSVKYQFIDMDREEVIVKGLVDRIGMEDALFTYARVVDNTEVKSVLHIGNHEEAIRLLIKMMIEGDYRIINDKSEIAAVGHRVVHGGEKFSGAVLVDNRVKEDIYECFDLAPLHNPHNLKGMEICEKLLQGVPQVAVFDTAFHQTMPSDAFFYAIPYYFYEKYKVRRYGFHGSSHQYVAHRAASMMKKKLRSLKVVTCHLGSGASITAIKNGKSVDTSMGFTPLEGLAMGTRCGDIDPAVPLYLMDVDEITLREIKSILNKQSGIYGLSGISSDMRDILKERKRGNKRAKLTVDVFVYRVKKYIGAYASAMNGLDVLVFTAGIGENSSYIRELCCRDMDYLGIEIDRKRNRKAEGVELLISSGKSKVSVFAIPTNEELVIAREANRILQNKKTVFT